jgi:hypothetical protein
MVGMGSIIRAKYFILAAAGLLAILVLSLSWPRFQASFRYLPVDRAIALYDTEHVIPTDRMEALIRFAGEAISHHDHYRYHDGLSQLHYLRGLDVYTPALERRDAYRQAEAEAVNSLTQAPAQPGPWLRLATIRWILHDEPEDIIQPWKMSIFSGRTHSGLYTQRVEMGLAQREFLDQEAVAMLRDQLLLAWELKPGELLKVLKFRDRDLKKTRELAGNTAPAALEEMGARLEKIR